MRLRDVGVVAGADGAVKLTEDAASLYLRSPWAVDSALAELDTPSSESECHPVGAASTSLAARPHAKHCRRIWIHCEAIMAADLHKAMLDESVLRAETLLSAGGKGSGCSWYIVPSRPSEMWPSSLFRLATQLRLGQVRPASNMTCCLERAPPNGKVSCGEYCEKPLTSQAHLVTCAV